MRTTLHANVQNAGLCEKPCNERMPKPGFSVVLYGSAYLASRTCGAWACCTGGFIAHSFVQVS
jgi:hypothetical protein